ncbi:hypothetical protein D3C78_1963240 [compost metagenome]
MLEDRTALRGNGQAEHMVESGDQFLQEPLLHFRHLQRLAAISRADLRQQFAVERLGGQGNAAIDQ